MRDVLAKMGKHGVAFAVGLMLTRLVGFVVMIPLSRVLTKADYGIADNLALASSLIMMIAAQGVPSGLFRAYAYEADSAADKARVIATAFRYTLISSVLMAIVIGGFAKPFSTAVTGSNEYWALVVLVLLTYLFSNLKNVCFQILRANYQSKQFLIVSCTEFLLCAALNIAFVVFFRMGPAGIVYSNLIGAAIALVLAVRFVPASIAGGYDSNVARGMAGFGIPLVPQAVLIFVLSSADRFIFISLLGEDRGLEASGLYGRAAQFASILDGVLLMPFMMLWPSVYYEIARRPTAARDLGRCATYYVVVALLLAVGLSSVAQPLVTLMLDREYHEAWRAVPVLAFGLACYGFSDVTKVGLMIRGATKRMPLYVLGAAIVSVGLNFLLIRPLGIVGAAAASVCAYASLALFMGLGGQRKFRIDYEWGRLIHVVAIAVTIAVLVVRWPMESDLTKIELAIEVLKRGGVVALGYPLLLFLTGFVRTQERELIASAIRRVLGRPRGVDPAAPRRNDDPVR